MKVIFAVLYVSPNNGPDTLLQNGSFNIYKRITAWLCG